MFFKFIVDLRLYGDKQIVTYAKSVRKKKLCPEQKHIYVKKKTHNMYHKNLEILSI